MKKLINLETMKITPFGRRALLSALPWGDSNRLKFESAAGFKPNRFYHLIRGNARFTMHDVMMIDGKLLAMIGLTWKEYAEKVDAILDLDEKDDFDKFPTLFHSYEHFIAYHQETEYQRKRGNKK